MEKKDNETELPALVRRIIAGDARAEEELVHRYKDSVSIIIARNVRNPFVTQDISQDTFIKVLEKIRRQELREPEKLSGFVCAIARNLAIDYLKKTRQTVTQEEITAAEQIPDKALNQLDQLCLKERGQIVRQIIDELKVKRDRDIIFRYYIGEEDKEQICADMKLTKIQFNRVIFRALARYKELYIEHIGSI